MRGVNKIVLELRPDDERFEKAILFLKPDKIGLPQKELSESAENLLLSINLSKYNKKSKKISSFFLIFAGIAAGSAVSWSIIYIISLIS